LPGTNTEEFVNYGRKMFYDVGPDVRVEAVLLGVRAGEDDDGGGGHVGRHGGEEEGRTRRRRSPARWGALSQKWSRHLKLALVVKALPFKTNVGDL